MNHCEIVRDLIPLCVDDAASGSSVEFVNAHIAACPECRRVMESMGKPLQIPVSTSLQMQSKKPFEKMKAILTRRMIRTAVISVLVICAVLVLCLMMNPNFGLHGEPLITEGKAAYHASLQTRAYIAFHAEEFPNADYDAIEPAVTVEFVEHDEEFFTSAYKVTVEYPVAGSSAYPAFEVLIDAMSGETLKKVVVNRG